MHGSNHYRILWTVSDMQGPCGFDLIVRFSHLPADVVARVIADLIDPLKNDDQPWLECRGDSYRIAGVKRDGEASTGGFRALEESLSAPSLAQLNTQRWVDEALTGITADGRQTRIINAVIPSCMRHTR